MSDTDINSRQDWVIFSDFDKYDFRDKESNINSQMRYMFARTNNMFEYFGLPDSIPKRSLELLMQYNGSVGIISVDGELYAVRGGLGGEPNPYYMPTKFTVANVALKISKVYTIDDDCVIIANDPMYVGLVPIFSKYVTGMIENELSMNLVSINARVMQMISAADDATRKSAGKYLEDIETGRQGVIADSALLESLKIVPGGTSSNNAILTDLIEYEQYLKASMYNEIGLQANYNMKRESINSDEAQLNDDALKPLIHAMLKSREIGIAKVNDMFGTDISVELSDVWKEKISGQPEKSEEPEEPEEPEKSEEPEDKE